MQDYGSISGGNSKMSLNRTSKGEYTWEMTLYFLGNSMTTIKQMIAKIGKSRVIIEHMLGQKVVPTESMSAYLKSLEAQVEKAVMAEGKEAKGRNENVQEREETETQAEA